MMTFDMTSYKPIDCSDYDYLEIVCMDHSEIELDIDSDTIRGVADGLEIRSGEEFLQLRITREQIREIRIDRISEIRVLSKVARFKNHTFERGKNRAPKD